MHTPRESFTVARSACVPALIFVDDAPTRTRSLPKRQRCCSDRGRALCLIQKSYNALQTLGPTLGYRQDNSSFSSV